MSALKDVGKAESQQGASLRAEIVRLRDKNEALRRSLQPLHDYWQAKGPVRQWGSDIVRLTLERIEELEEGK